MGDYIYALRSPKHCKKVLVMSGIDGEYIETVVGSVSYLYKPNWHRPENDEKWLKMFTSKMDKAWKSTKRPKLVAFTHGNTNHRVMCGQTVYAYEDAEKEFPMLYNDGWESAKPVGTIIATYRKVD